MEQGTSLGDKRSEGKARGNTSRRSGRGGEGKAWSPSHPRALRGSWHLPPPGLGQQSRAALTGLVSSLPCPLQHQHFERVQFFPSLSSTYLILHLLEVFSGFKSDAAFLAEAVPEHHVQTHGTPTYPPGDAGFCHPGHVPCRAPLSVLFWACATNKSVRGDTSGPHEYPDLHPAPPPFNSRWSFCQRQGLLQRLLNYFPA